MRATPVRRSIIAAVLMVVLISALTPHANAASPIPSGKHFGFNTQLGAWYNTSPSSGVTAASEATVIQLAGGDTQRLTVSWAELQPVPPAANGPQLPAVTAIDASVRNLVQRGMRPVIAIINAPLWASTLNSCGLLDINCSLGRQTNEHLAPAAASVAAYARFVRALAARYPTAYIETWNEPNEAYWWQSSFRAYTPNPSLMAQMQCAAYDAVKRLGNPGQLVLSPGFGNALTNYTQTVVRKWIFQVSITTTSFRDYVGAMYRTMGRTCWDRLNVHVYHSGDMTSADSGFVRSWEMIRATRAAAVPADRTPIWVTETGISTSGRQPATTTVQHVVQTEGVHKMLAMADVEAVIVHTLRDAPIASGLLNPSSTEYGFGMIQVDGSPKPAFCAYVDAAGNDFPGC